MSLLRYFRVGRGSDPKNLLLKRTDEGGRGQEVLIDQITHLGRSGDGVDCGIRPQGRFINDAKLAVLVEPVDKRDPHVSRNHALIYPPDVSHPTFYVRPLNSLNGTDLNGRRLRNGSRYALQEGDVISFADEAVFECAYPEVTSNYGLLVGHDGGNLKGIENDVSKFANQFRRRGFTLDSLVNGGATPKAVVARLKEMGNRLTDDSIFLFYFSGHGSKSGKLQLSEWFANLETEGLFKILNNFRGQKLIVLDGCYTGEVDEEKLPSRSVLIGNKGKGYEGNIASLEMTCNIGAIPDGDKVMGYCTNALYKVLDGHLHRIDIGKLFFEARKDPRIVAKRQEMRLQEGTMIFLPTVQDMEGRSRKSFKIS
jgi:hypothetical protein